MKLVNKYTVKRRIPEKISQVDYVDRSGFIPLDVQAERMKTAGEELSLIRAYQYNTDLEKLNILEQSGDIEGLDIDTLSSDIKTQKLDKVVLDEKLKQHMREFKKFKSKADELQSLKSKYDQAVREKELITQAVNQYKKGLKKATKVKIVKK